MTPNAEPQPGTPRRREVGRFVAWTLLTFGIVIGVDAVAIEPYRIEVTHYEIRGPVASKLKIAHLSDLHTHGVGGRERRLFEILSDEKPDMIVVTGDTLAHYGGHYPQARDVYTRLHAPLGVWVVHGNFENAKPMKRERAFYEEAGVHLLVNASRPVRPDVWVVGLDDMSSGNPRLDTALTAVPPGVFTVALFHAPAFFDRAAGHVNLCLAGHTHGGQVRFPFLQPLWLPNGCGRYVEGWYEEGGSKMYVSRGIGTSLLPVRFLCRPEVTFITVIP